VIDILMATQYSTILKDFPEKGGSEMHTGNTQMTIIFSTTQLLLVVNSASILTIQVYKLLMTASSCNTPHAAEGLCLTIDYSHTHGH